MRLQVPTLFKLERGEAAEATAQAPGVSKATSETSLLTSETSEPRKDGT